MRAANKPCIVTGSMMTAWMAPFIKRRASGHLQYRSVLESNTRSWVMDLLGFCLVERAKGMVGFR